MTERGKNQGRAPTYLLVTGSYRSGTTLVEKMLNMHPQVICASQPFPVFYFFVMDLFHRMKGLQRRYPLGHLFLEDGYTPDDLHRFLDERVITAEELTSFWELMAGYTGLWTPQMMQFRGQVRPGTFWEIYSQLNRSIQRLFPKDGARYLGGKDTKAEEYITFLLKRGVKVVNVIRDPRGMIASLSFNERESLTGKNRPVLYSLRSWRKSVAISFACEGDKNFLWLRYEDFVRNPQAWTARLTDFLGVPPYPEDAFKDGIRDQWGRVWRGNSSFQDSSGISEESLDKFVRKLPPEVLAYIEAICYPEMKALGYPFLAAGGFAPEVIQSYEDPFADIHPKFSAGYSHAPERVERELQRYKLLISDESLPVDQQRLWFVAEAAYDKLRVVVNSQ